MTIADLVKEVGGAALARRRTIVAEKTTYISVGEGELIPCDGVVIEGCALVDESAIAGVSAPALIDDTHGRNQVFKGGLVVSGQLKIKPNKT